MKANAITLAPIAAALLLAFNAAAQEHSQHPMPAPPAQEQSGAPAPACVHPDHAAHVADASNAGACEPPPQSPASVDHAAMHHATSGQDSASEVDHAAMGHEVAAPEPRPMDHAAMGHDVPPGSTPEPTPVDHAAMGHAAPRTGHLPTTPIPEPTAADRAAARRPTGGHAMHDDTRQGFVLIDRLEAFDAVAGHGLEWEAQAWIGTDMDKLWLRSEGEQIGGNTEDADLELLYGRSVARWWDVVAGVRHHFEPGGSQDMAVLGVMGVAPYKFEVAASLYLGESGYTGARLEVEYETLLTNRLILQPAIEVNLHGREDPAHGNGSGLGTVEAGLRLRYEVTRHFAPYVGVVHERAYGDTADLRREEGEDVNDSRIVAGIRVWF